MKKYTVWDTIKKVITLQKFRYKVEYYFAKRWLDNSPIGLAFGEQEYWGEFLMEHLTPPKQ